MIALEINLDGHNAWPDLSADSNVVHLGMGSPSIKVAVLDGGLASGRPSVAIRFDVPGGQTVIAETSARLFVLAARAIEARYPGLFDGPG